MSFALSDTMTLLQVRPLDPETVEELIDATKAMDWPSLYPVLWRMADVFCSGAHVGDSNYQMMAAFEALHLLLGMLQSTC